MYDYGLYSSPCPLSMTLRFRVRPNLFAFLILNQVCLRVHTILNSLIFLLPSPKIETLGNNP
jgi:hypothetical protein